MEDFDEFIHKIPDEPLGEQAQQRHLQFLRNLPREHVTPAPTRRGSRRRRAAIASGIALGVVVAVGGGTAAAINLWSPASDISTGYCYARANLDDSATNRFEFAVAGTPDRPNDASAVATDVCAVYWRSGAVTADGANADQPPTGGSYTVPMLIACVLPDGKAGVFPGTETTCAQLGLDRLQP